MQILDSHHVQFRERGLCVDSTLFQRIFYHIRHIQDEVKAFSGKDIQLPIYVMTSEFNRQEIENNIHSFFSLVAFLNPTFPRESLLQS